MKSKYTLMKTKKLISCCTILFLALSLCGQENTEGEKSTRSLKGPYISYGLQMPDFSELNTILAANDYATLEETDLSFGIGFAFKTKHVIIQADAFRYIQCIDSQDEICSHMIGSGLGLSAGYDFLKNDQFDLYPLLGVSYDMGKLQISENEILQTQFNSYLPTRNQSEMINISYSLHMGLQFDFLPLLCKNTGERWMLGIRAGYYYPLLKNEWYMHEKDIELENGPEINTSGTYAKLILGVYL